MVFAAKMSNVQPSSHDIGLANGHEQPVPIDVEGRRSSEDVNLKDHDDLPNQHAQHGVQMVEAVTLAWTKKTLAAAYIL